MLSLLSLAGLLASAAAQGTGPGTFTPARPPSIPLAVKSPYLSAWLDVAGYPEAGKLAGAYPNFWTNTTLGWAGLIRVDGKPYTWMGAVEGYPFADQSGVEYTSTKSIFHQSVGGLVNLTVTFLSPITPLDYVRQSLISSYLEVQVSSLDGKDHDVQLYTDISAEWISGDRSAIAQWDYGVAPIASAPSTTGVVDQHDPTPAADIEHFGTRTSYSGWRAAVTHGPEKRSGGSSSASSYTPPQSTTTTSSSTSCTTTGSSVSSDSASSGSVTSGSSASGTASSSSASSSPSGTSGGIAYHRVYRQTQLAFSEVDQQTEYGYWYYMTANTVNLTHQSGEDCDVRAQFADHGYLTDVEDTDYRAINDSFPVFGFAIDLGSVGSTAVSSLFTINLNQQLAVQFEGANGNQTVPSLWASYFASDLDADTYFYNDYYNYALSTATTFDAKIESDSVAAAGTNYSLITSLSVRQAFGAIQLCGTPNQTFTFLKEISSDGNVNTVDVMFPWHPIILYTNPEILKFALEPLYINQEAGYWPFAFAIHDIGSHYPNATGHNDGNAEQQPLEECGDMIIMTLAYAQRANDNTFLSDNYKLLDQWVGYLIEEALIPANQISTDDFAGALPNQTNLALKGIIGISAMAEIANRTGHTEDYTNYTNIANSYISQWINLATTNYSLPHTTLNYGNTTTYSLLYNLYAAPLLSMGDFVPQIVYDRQSAFYPTVVEEYGVPLDTRHLYTKLDWQCLCASIASKSTSTLFIDRIADWINNTPLGYPLTDLYETDTGDAPFFPPFTARPVVGGTFSFLALPADSVPAK